MKKTILNPFRWKRKVKLDFFQPEKGIKALLHNWKITSNDNRDNGVSEKETQQQARHDLDEIELSIQERHDPFIMRDQAELDNVLKNIKTIRESFSDYVASEMKATPEEVLIDKDVCAARLEELYQEQEDLKKIYSPLNSKTDEKK